MSVYIVLMNATSQGLEDIEAVPEGIEKAHKAIEDLGGEVLGCYLAMGEYDFVGIYDLPGDEAAMAYALGLGATGAVRTKTMKAISFEALPELIEKLPKAEE